MLTIEKKWTGESLFRLNLIVLIITSRVTHDIDWFHRKTIKICGVTVYDNSKSDLPFS